MSQGDLGTLVPAETSGTELASRLRTQRDALNTLHSGATRPSYAQPGMLWLDTSGVPWLMKMWTGVVDVEMMTINPTTGVTSLRIGFTASDIAARLAPQNAGEYVFLPSGFIPAGKRIIKANGATLVRADYPHLFAYSQDSGYMSPSQETKTPASFGPGDGSTTFTLPDARGYFLRAFDDGRGIDAGRVISAIQSDGVRNFYVELPMGFDGSTMFQAIFDSNFAPIFGSKVVTVRRTANGHSGAEVANARIAYSSGAVFGNGETRPVNLAAVLGIRY